MEVSNLVLIFSFMGVGATQKKLKLRNERVYLDRKKKKWNKRGVGWGGEVTFPYSSRTDKCNMYITKNLQMHKGSKKWEHDISAVWERKNLHHSLQALWDASGQRFHFQRSAEIQKCFLYLSECFRWKYTWKIKAHFSYVTYPNT